MSEARWTEPCPKCGSTNTQAQPAAANPWFRCLACGEQFDPGNPMSGIQCLTPIAGQARGSQ